MVLIGLLLEHVHYISFKKNHVKRALNSRWRLATIEPNTHYDFSNFFRSCSYKYN